MRTEFCGMTFENPFILAPAPPTDELDMLRRGLEAGWAGAVLKTTSVPGTSVVLKYPMISRVDTPGGQFLGLGNIDLISRYHTDEVCERIVKLKREFPDKIIIGSMMGAKKEDWQENVRMLEEAGADAIECSFSCPQGTLGEKPGAMLSQNTELVEKVTEWIKGAAKRCPVIIKITPQVADIVESAWAVKRGGGDAVCASNTIPSLMGIDMDTLRPVPDISGKTSYSGLSGPAIKPITLRVIAEISRHTGIPITGTGGAMTWRDAVEFLLVGARNVQFCTAVMIDGFAIIDKLVSGLQEFMEKHGFAKVEDFIGHSLQYITTHDQLPDITKGLAKINPEKCIRCGKCYVACRDGGHMAIERLEDMSVRVIREKCTGCGLCKVVCPVKGCITINPDI